MRGAVIRELLVLLKVLTKISIEINNPPYTQALFIASTAAMVFSFLLIFSKNSIFPKCRNAAFDSKYKPITMKVPKPSAIGILRFGFLISPPKAPTLFQPSKAQKAAIIAAKKEATVTGGAICNDSGIG